MKSQKLIEFEQENRNLLKQPIIQSFLNNNDNFRLYKKAVCKPTKENRNNLDKEFKIFYAKVRLIKYMSILIHYFAIEYDKKIRVQQKRFPLLVEQSFNFGNENLLDKLESNYNFKLNNSANLIDHIECPFLITAIEQLTPKQKLILKYIYIDNLKINEVAKMLNHSPQNISKINRIALKRIKEFVLKEDKI